MIDSPILRGSSAQRPAVTGDLVVLEIQPGGLVSAITTADGAEHVLNFGEAVPGIPQGISAAGTHVFWEDCADLVRLAHGSPGGPPSWLHRADPGDVKHLHTDGEALAWIQGYGRSPGVDYARVELWTAPLASGAAELRPRLVRELPARGEASFGGGWYARFLGSPRRIELVRMDDGTRRAWIPPTGHVLPGAPLYVTDREMLVVSGPRVRRRLVRVDPHTGVTPMAQRLRPAKCARDRDRARRVERLRGGPSRERVRFQCRPDQSDGSSSAPS